MIRVAVQSAKQNTKLRPNLLYDGKENSFVAELRSVGVNVIHRRVSFYDALEHHGANEPNYLSIASGAFLRFEMSLIDDNDFALYTDCDVLFRSHPDFYSASKPQFFSTSSQMSLDPTKDMNSGVMLVNVSAMRADYSTLIDFTRHNLSLGFDQEILQVFYEGRYQPMDRSLNWKPYWGINSSAQIVHFHGPKPGAARHMAEKIDSIPIQQW